MAPAAAAAADSATMVPEPSSAGSTTRAATPALGPPEAASPPSSPMKCSPERCSLADSPTTMRSPSVSGSPLPQQQQPSTLGSPLAAGAARVALDFMDEEGSPPAVLQHRGSIVLAGAPVAAPSGSRTTIGGSRERAAGVDGTGGRVGRQPAGEGRARRSLAAGLGASSSQPSSACLADEQQSAGAEPVIDIVFDGEVAASNGDAAASPAAADLQQALILQGETGEGEAAAPAAVAAPIATNFRSRLGRMRLPPPAMAQVDEDEIETDGGGAWPQHTMSGATWHALSASLIAYLKAVQQSLFVR